MSFATQTAAHVEADGDARGFGLVGVGRGNGDGAVVLSSLRDDRVEQALAQDGDDAALLADVAARVRSSVG